MEDEKAGGRPEYEALKLGNQICFPLYACAREIIKRYSEPLKALDITYTQYITMMVLWEHRCLSVKELGKCLHLDSGTLTPVLKSLEVKGYVERRRSAEDERVLLCTLTPAGEELRDRAVSVPYEVGCSVKLAPEEAAQLHALLHKMLSAMEE